MINYALLRSQVSAFYMNLCRPDTDLQTKLFPYEDRFISMYEHSYDDPREMPTEVNERALDKFISRIIFNQAVTLSDGAEYHESIEASPLGYNTAKIPEKYIGDVRKVPNDQVPKQRGTKGAKRGRSRKPRDKSMDEDDIQFRDLPDDTDITQKDGKTMVTMSIDMLRGYMYTEVEARVRYIHDFYERQWNDINREKMVLYTEIHDERKNVRKLEMELAQLHYHAGTHQRQLDDLNSKVNTSKEAKRRRRQAKKQRKQTTLTGSMSDTNTDLCDGVSENPESNTSQFINNSTETGTCQKNEEAMPGGGDVDSGPCEQNKKLSIGDIDAEISALVL